MKKNVLVNSLFAWSCASLGAEIAEVNAYANNCAPKDCCVATCCPEIVEDCCFCDVCPPCNQITPNAGPCVKNGSNLYAIAAFTYWTAHEDNLAMGNVKSSFITTGTLTPQSKMPQPNWKGNPGFKVGIGYDFCHDGWDSFLNYTWFRTHNNKKSVNASSNEVIEDDFWGVNAALFPATGFISMAQSVRANWNLHLNIFDWELGRNFYISRRIQLRPYFGLKGMWYKQDYKLTFGVLPGGVPLYNNRMLAQMKNWGLGVRGGIDTSWHFCRDLSLIGELAVTGLWEHFKVTRKDETFSFLGNATSGPTGTLTNLFNTEYTYYTLKPILEWMLGFRWEMWTCCDEFHFALDAGWEAQHWFSQNKFIRNIGSDTANGDLVIQGLTVRARFDF